MTVVARSLCVCWMIDGTEWRHILERYPKLCKSFDLKAIESIQDVPRFFAYLLQCFKFLADFDSRFLLNVAPKMKGRRWTAGEYIIKEDEEGTSMYFVHRGAVSVYIKGKRIAELKDHTCFGELAVLTTNSTRTATVIAEEPTITWDRAELYDPGGFGRFVSTNF